MVYQIKIMGRVDPSWSDWLGDATVLSGCEENGAAITILTVDAADQSALFGILDHIRDMNLLPTSVELLDQRPLETKG